MSKVPNKLGRIILIENGSDDTLSFSNLYAINEESEKKETRFSRT